MKYKLYVESSSSPEAETLPVWTPQAWKTQQFSEVAAMRRSSGLCGHQCGATVKSKMLASWLYTHKLRLHRSYWGLCWWSCWTPKRYTTGPYSSPCTWTAEGEMNGGEAVRKCKENLLVSQPSAVLVQAAREKIFTSRNWWKTGKRGHVVSSSKASMDLAVSMSKLLWSLSW